MRLINADKLINDIVHKYGRDQSDAILEIAEVPIVDAVPVVRCKNCKYRTVDNDVVRYNCGLHLVVNLNDNDFCSRGVRKE